MMIASGIFAVMMLLIVGATLSISDAELKTEKLQSIQDNLRFAVEAMTKEMRTGTDFQLFGSDHLIFIRSDGALIVYCLKDGLLQKRTHPSGSGGTGCGSGDPTSPVTGPSVVIELLRFELTGAAAGSADGQPRITVAIRARSADVELATTFQLQTTITARLRDSG